MAHFRPRGSLKAFFKQYYRYTAGDGKADLWRKKHLIRYATYLLILPGLITLGLLHSPGWWFVLLAGVMLYSATPFRRLQPHLPNLGSIERMKAVLLIPMIRAVGDLAKMLGYPQAGSGGCGIENTEVHWRKTAPEAKTGDTSSPFDAY